MDITRGGLVVDLPETILPTGLLDVAVAGAARYDVSAHTGVFRQMLTWALAAAVDAGYITTDEEDPVPTTGGPYGSGLPTGCRCHLREDVEYGEVRTRPSDGVCPIHPPQSLTVLADELDWGRAPAAIGYVTTRCGNLQPHEPHQYLASGSGRPCVGVPLRISGPGAPRVTTCWPCGCPTSGPHRCARAGSDA